MYHRHLILQVILNMPNKLLSTVDMLMATLAKSQLGKRHRPADALSNRFSSPRWFHELLRFPSFLAWFSVHTSTAGGKGLT